MMSRYCLTPTVIGFAIVAACGARPETPTQPGTPTASSSQAPTALQIEGPSSIAPGATAQYRAIASFPDGRRQDVTTEASWVSSNAEPVLLVADRGLVAARGMVTGGSPGEANLTAHYPATFSTPDSEVILPGTVSGEIRVLVLEPGTFRVSGLVTESGLPFPGVKVAVVSGRRAGLIAPTASDGTFVMYGLAGATDLAVSEEGLQPATRSIVVTDHQTGVDFHLQPRSGYDSLTGDWRLMLQASPSCGSEILQDAATRTFGARITQRGPQLSLDVTSPTRVILNDYPVSGHGGVSGASMSFRLQMDAEQTPPRWVLLEMLEPRRFLGIAGYAEGQRSSDIVSGWLSGDFSIYRAAGTNYLSPGTVLEGRCYRKIGEDSSLHTFRLERN